MFGKVFGAGLGLAAIGGPGGVLLGLLTGHAIDMLYADTGLYFPGVKRQTHTTGHANGQGQPDPSRSGPQPGNARFDGPDKKNRSSTHWVEDLTRLAAKVAKSDGHVTPAEIRVFKEAPIVKQANSAVLGHIFNEAKLSARGVDAPAMRLTEALGLGSKRTMAVLDILVAIAVADGRVHMEARRTLLVIAQCLGHTPEQLESLILRREPLQSGPSSSTLEEDCRLLGVTPETDEKSLKSAYRKLAMKLHPDTMIARGVSADRIALAEQKLARINTAYERILVEKGWK